MQSLQPRLTSFRTYPCLSTRQSLQALEFGGGKVKIRSAGSRSVILSRSENKSENCRRAMASKAVTEEMHESRETRLTRGPSLLSVCTGQDHVRGSSRKKVLNDRVFLRHPPNIHLNSPDVLQYTADDFVLCQWRISFSELHMRRDALSTLTLPGTCRVQQHLPVSSFVFRDLQLTNDTEKVQGRQRLSMVP